MMPEDPPKFEHADHPKIWNQLSKNSELINENSEAIAVLKSDMDWTKRILTGIFAAICITLISLIISML